MNAYTSLAANENRADLPMSVVATGSVIRFPTPQRELARWYDTPQAQGLIASLTKRPPLAETRFATYAITRDEWSEYVGMRVDALRAIYDRFGEELLALYNAAYLDFGPDAPQAAIDGAYAPFVAYAAETVDYVIDRALGRVA